MPLGRTSKAFSGKEETRFAAGKRSKIILARIPMAKPAIASAE
jgi:hypothetical protein